MTMPPTTPKSPARTRENKISPAKLDPLPTMIPTKPDKAIVKAKNNVLDTSSPNVLATKFDAMSLAGSPGSSPTKRVYHASPAKENRPTGETPSFLLRPPEEDSPGMTEQAKKSLRSINALRGLTIEEIEKINRPNVKRLATTTQLCNPRTTTDIDFIDHYFDLLTYLADRRRRLDSFKAAHPPPEGSYANTRSATAWKDYCGRERAALRKRRTKTKCNDFSILSQIGQGGYGQVFLARKKDTGEVVALKKMNVLPLEMGNCRKECCTRWMRFGIFWLKGISSRAVVVEEDG
jgi:cell cycle protein kinase DBF2